MVTLVHRYVIEIYWLPNTCSFTTTLAAPETDTTDDAAVTLKTHSKCKKFNNN